MWLFDSVLFGDVVVNIWENPDWIQAVEHPTMHWDMIGMKWERCIYTLSPKKQFSIFMMFCIECCIHPILFTRNKYCKKSSECSMKKQGFNVKNTRVLLQRFKEATMAPLYFPSHIGSNMIRVRVWLCNMKWSMEMTASEKLQPVGLWKASWPGYKFLLNCFAPGERERLKAPIMMKQAHQWRGWMDVAGHPSQV